MKHLFFLDSQASYQWRNSPMDIYIIYPRSDICRALNSCQFAYWLKSYWYIIQNPAWSLCSSSTVFPPFVKMCSGTVSSVTHQSKSDFIFHTSHFTPRLHSAIIPSQLSLPNCKPYIWGRSIHAPSFCKASQDLQAFLRITPKEHPSLKTYSTNQSLVFNFFIAWVTPL